MSFTPGERGGGICRIVFTGKRPRFIQWKRKKRLSLIVQPVVMFRLTLPQRGGLGYLNFFLTPSFEKRNRGGDYRRESSFYEAVPIVEESGLFVMRVVS